MSSSQAAAKNIDFSDANFVADDYSRGFQAVRAHLRNERGASYVEFIRGLKPNYRKVYADIALGYFMLAISAASVVFLPSAGVSSWLVVPLCALLIGYWIAYIQLFIHEGAHFNLAPDRDQSDRLCDVLVGWMIGTRVADYRKVHFQHHRALGTTEDSEFSYFFPVNVLGLLKAALGIRAIQVLLSRRKFLHNVQSRRADRAPSAVSVVVEADSEKDQSRKKASRKDLYPMLGLVTHGTIIIGSYLAGVVPLAIAWFIGAFMMFPLFGALRQALEHRREDASPDVDYRLIDHGHFTRMFGSDAFSSTFGGAGFNRHLLHHWEPQVSYTNLPEVEAFLTTTSMGGIVEARRSSYMGVFLTLLSLR